MINRRKLLASSAALGVLGLAAPASAHALGEDYVLPEEYMPREVRIRAEFEPGVVLVDPNQFALFWTMPDQKAIRYTVGIGRSNLYHDGEFYVGRKVEWPDWRPSPDMMERSPEAYENFLPEGKYEDGMPGGINNPLGARALYLYNIRTNRDTYLRIHGTNDPRTIGKAVSNGCARLINPQVEQLFDLVPNGTRVVLYPKSGAGPAHSNV